jgi:SAM-dependent methyltransferase
VRTLDGAPPNPEERRLMDERVAAILDGYTVEAYRTARGGLAEAERWIAETLSRSGVALRGRVLEFGAGNAKLSAIVSRLPEVDEAVANDFSAPLLTEIAPRVVSLLGGRLDKLTFLLGDMHSLPTLDERFDAIVCYLAVHHLYLPEHFFSRIAGLLVDGGSIVCVREPALPRIQAFRAVRGSVEHARGLRREGESEHTYTVRQYRELAEPAFSFRLAHVSAFERRLRLLRDRLPPLVWPRPFEIAYVLEKVRA